MTETELVARLERLERDNRKMKRLTAAALVLAATVWAIAATRPVPQKITAHEFEVLDSRGKAATIIGSRQVSILDSESGLPRVVLGEVVGTRSPNYYAIWLFSGHGSQTIQAVPGATGANISLFDSTGVPRAELDIASGNPKIRLNDARGFEMDLGSTSLTAPRTGATQLTSADSIVMFGNDKEHRVIWKAP